MIVLDATNETLELVLGGAAATTNPDYVASYVDVTTTTYAPGNTGGALNGSTPVTAVAAPGSSTQRQVKLLTVHNLDTAAVALTVQVNFNSTTRILWKGTLGVGETLQYVDGGGFDVMGYDGSTKLVGPNPVGSSVGVLTAGAAQKIFRSDLHPSGTIAVTTGTIYWVYVGFLIRPVTVRYVECYMTSAGSGTQTAEVGLASSPGPPAKASQTLTKIIADATLDTLTASAAVKRNTNGWGQLVPAGTHLWAGLRCALGTTQPTWGGLAGDFAQGFVLTTAAGGDMTSGSSWTGSIIAVSTSTVCPDLRVTQE